MFSFFLRQLTEYVITGITTEQQLVVVTAQPSVMAATRVPVHGAAAPAAVVVLQTHVRVLSSTFQLENVSIVSRVSARKTFGFSGRRL